MKRLSLIPIFFGFFSMMYAQNNFQPGYIITLEGDTLNGEINSRNWIVSPNSIELRINSEVTNYSALAIRGFGVDNERYQSAIVETEISSRDLSSLSYTKDLEIKADTLFLRIIYMGSNTLYSSANDQGIENFYIGVDGEIQLLKYKKYLIQMGGPNPLLKENMFFTNQLNVYLGDCEDLRKKISGLKYSEASLSKIFAQYDACMGTAPDAYTFKKKDGQPFLAVIGGFTSTSTQGTSSSENFDNVRFANFPSSNKPSYGLGFGISIPKKRSYIQIRGEVLYSSFNLFDSVSITSPGGSVTALETSFNINSLGINMMARYAKNLGKVDVFVNAGPSYNLLTIKENTTLRSRFSNGVLISESESDALLLPSGELGYLVGLGFSIGKFSCEFRHQGSQGLGKRLDDLEMPLKRNSVLLSYAVPLRKE